MTALTQTEIQEYGTKVVLYLKGENLLDVKLKVRSWCDAKSISGRKLYKMIDLTKAQNKNQPWLNEIFDTLNVTNQHRAELLDKSNNLHDLLRHLYHDGHVHLLRFLNILDRTKKRWNWTKILLTSTGLFLIAGIFLSVKKQYLENAIHWLKKNINPFLRWLSKTLPHNIPFIFIFFHSISLLHSWYTALTNGTRFTGDKIRNLFIKTLTAGLSITSYTLIYLAHGVMPVPAVVLFILGSTVDLFQSIYLWGRSKQALKLDVRNPTAKDIRAENFHQRTINSVYVRLAATAFIAMAVALWCFFPSNLVIMVCAISFIFLVSQTKQVWLNKINREADGALQASLRDHFSEESKQHHHTPRPRTRSMSALDELKMKEPEEIKRIHLSFFPPTTTIPVSGNARKDNSETATLANDTFRP